MHSNFDIENQSQRRHKAEDSDSDDVIFRPKKQYDDSGLEMEDPGSDKIALQEILIPEVTDEELERLKAELAEAQKDQKKILDDFANATAWSWLKYLVAVHPGKPNAAELLQIRLAQGTLAYSCYNIASFVGYFWPAILMGQVQNLDDQSNSTSLQQHLTDKSNVVYYSSNSAAYMYSTIVAGVGYVITIRSTYSSIKERMQKEAADRVAKAEQELTKYQRSEAAKRDVLAAIENAKKAHFARIDAAKKELNAKIESAKTEILDKVTSTAEEQEKQDVDRLKLQIGTMEKNLKVQIDALEDKFKLQNEALVKQFEILDIQNTLHQTLVKNNNVIADILKNGLEPINQVIVKTDAVTKELTDIKQVVEKLSSEKKND